MKKSILLNKALLSLHSSTGTLTQTHTLLNDINMQYQPLAGLLIMNKDVMTLPLIFN